MLKKLVLILALVALPLAAAQAAEIYNKPKGEAVEAAPAPAPSPELRPVEPATPAAEAPATAEPTEPAAISPVQAASAYYENCMKQSNPMLDAQNQVNLCACTAEKFARTMTPEDVKEMSQPTEAGAAQRNRMILNVYAPCIRYPAHALVNYSCLNDTRYKMVFGDKAQSVCGCLAENMSAYMEKVAPDAIRQAIASGADMTDPLRTLLESDGYAAQEQKVSKACMKQAGLKF